MSADYERELTAIAATVEPPEQQVTPEAITIATEALYAIDEKYGPDSENPLAFHNGDHSLGVTRRTIRFTNILYPYIRPHHRVRIYDLGMIGGSTHDYERGLGRVEDEKVSGDYAVAQVTELGGPSINNNKFKKRLFDGIQATAVDPKENGDIVQMNLQRGSHDPFKFALSFGDINGIAMEGSTRMFSDATNLCDEMQGGEPPVDEYCNFLISQAGFLRKRLNDPRIKSDIAYYFPDDIDEVYRDMRKAFHSNILSAYATAVAFGERRPELKASVEAAVHRVGSIDKALLGNLIGKTLHRKLAR